MDGVTKPIEIFRMCWLWSKVENLASNEMTGEPGGGGLARRLRGFTDMEKLTQRPMHVIVALADGAN